MTLKLFHCADLHLSRSERAYGFSVLEELVYHCRRLEADAWLLSGDVFDSREDLSELWGDFRAHLKDLGDLPVYMIPGNHELTGGLEAAALASLAAEGEDASLQLLLETPFGLLRPPGLEAEILTVPFQRGYGDYPDWHPPPKERRWRVGMLHGVVNGMTYTGRSEEEEHAAIDPDLFARLELDYAALGHIHSRGEARFGPCLAHYPGSARVWRRGEAEGRRATLAVLDDEGVRAEAVELESAGGYRQLTVSLDGEGAPMEHESAEALLDALEAGQGANDWLRIELDGFVERLQPVEALVRRLERHGEGRFRRIEVVLDGVVEAERLGNHPLVRAFDVHWRRRHGEAVSGGDVREAALLQRARRLALEEIQNRIGDS